MLTTLAAIVGEVLPAVITIGSIYRCAHIVSFFALVARLVEATKRSNKTTKRVITRECVDRNTPNSPWLIGPAQSSKVHKVVLSCPECGNASKSRHERAGVAETGHVLSTSIHIFVSFFPR